MLFKNIRHSRSFSRHSNKHFGRILSPITTVVSGANELGVPKDARLAWNSHCVCKAKGLTLVKSIPSPTQGGIHSLFSDIVSSMGVLRLPLATEKKTIAG